MDNIIILISYYRIDKHEDSYDEVEVGVSRCDLFLVLIERH